MSVNRWIDTENAVYIHSGILFSHGRIVFHLSCLKESGKYAERNKWGRKRQTVLFCYLTHLKSPIMKPRLSTMVVPGGWRAGSSVGRWQWAVCSVATAVCDELGLGRTWFHIFSPQRKHVRHSGQADWMTSQHVCVCPYITLYVTSRCSYAYLKTR